MRRPASLLVAAALLAPAGGLVQTATDVATGAEFFRLVLERGAR